MTNKSYLNLLTVLLRAFKSLKLELSILHSQITKIPKSYDWYFLAKGFEATHLWLIFRHEWKFQLIAEGQLAIKYIRKWQRGSTDRKTLYHSIMRNFSEIWINWMCNYPIEMTSSSFSSAMTLSLSFVFQMLAIWILTYKLLVALIKSYFIKAAIRALSCLLI